MKNRYTSFRSAQHPPMNDPWTGHVTRHAFPTHINMCLSVTAYTSGQWSRQIKLLFRGIHQIRKQTLLLVRNIKALMSDINNLEVEGHSKVITTHPPAVHNILVTGLRWGSWSTQPQRKANARSTQVKCKCNVNIFLPIFYMEMHLGS